MFKMATYQYRDGDFLLPSGNLLYTASVMSRCCPQALGAAHTNCVKWCVTVSHQPHL